MEASELLERIEKLERRVSILEGRVRPKRAFTRLRSAVGWGDDAWEEPVGGGGSSTTYNFGGLMGALTNREAAVVVPALKGIGTGIATLVVTAIPALPIAGTTHRWWVLAVPPVTGIVVGAGTFLALMAWHEIRVDRAATGKNKKRQKDTITAIEHQQRGPNGALERVRFLELGCSVEEAYRFAEYADNGGSLAINTITTGRRIMPFTAYKAVREELIINGYMQDKGSNVGGTLTENGRVLIHILRLEGIRRGVLSRPPEWGDSAGSPAERVNRR